MVMGHSHDGGPLGSSANGLKVGRLLSGQLRSRLRVCTDLSLLLSAKRRDGLVDSPGQVLHAVTEGRITNTPRPWRSRLAGYGIRDGATLDYLVSYYVSLALEREAAR